MSDRITKSIVRRFIEAAASNKLNEVECYLERFEGLVNFKVQ